MKLLRKEQSLVLWCFSASLLLSSCGGAGPECGSLDTRNSVVKIVSDDNNNKLVNYAVKNSSSVAAMVGDTKSEAEKLAWKRSDGVTTKAPPDERGGNGYVLPNVTAPHLDSTCAPCKGGASQWFDRGGHHVRCMGSEPEIPPDWLPVSRSGHARHELSAPLPTSITIATS